MKITIAGDLYSGKSCVGKTVCETLNYTYYSVGELQRKLAVEKGMSITEYNTYVFENNLDKEIDDRTIKIGLEKENFIFDARLAWHFIPDSFKIYLKVEIDVAVDRALKSERGKSENYSSKSDAKDHITQRRRLEVSRFRDIYNVSIDEDSNYDLAIDTSHISMEEVVGRILEKVRGRS
ncbi:MAG: cytidylate kinase family protein [Clostridium sp.]|uniref:cytidylate kinase family protein n=1 Tax=Clostridium sp. TaxID=1506 RepID=UPI003D6CE681